MFHSSKHILDKINKVYLQEAALYSDYLEVAGRVDCIAEYDGKLSIIDFKTSAEQKKETGCMTITFKRQRMLAVSKNCMVITVEQLVTIVACENGEVQVSIVEPKKEYFLRLQEYIQEYQDKHGR